MGLPYEHATSGKRAVEDMRKLLLGFGASSFGVMEYFGSGEVVAQFELRGQQVTVRASFEGYTRAWLAHHPWNSRMKLSKPQHEERARKQGQVAVYSILRDWIRGQVTAVEIGMLSFQAAFLGQLTGADGRSVLEAVTSSGMLRLGVDDD